MVNPPNCSPAASSSCVSLNSLYHSNSHPDGQSATERNSQDVPDSRALVHPGLLSIFPSLPSPAICCARALIVEELIGECRLMDTSSLRPRFPSKASPLPGLRAANPFRRRLTPLQCGSSRLIDKSRHSGTDSAAAFLCWGEGGDGEWRRVQSALTVECGNAELSSRVRGN